MLNLNLKEFKMKWDGIELSENCLAADFRTLLHRDI